MCLGVVYEKETVFVRVLYMCCVCLCNKQVVQAMMLRLVLVLLFVVYMLYVGCGSGVAGY